MGVTAVFYQVLMSYFLCSKSFFHFSQCYIRVGKGSRGQEVGHKCIVRKDGTVVS